MQRMTGRIRRDSKKRILRAGETQRSDGRYQYKYVVGGKARFLYSTKLEATDPLPKGAKPCKALREMELELGVHQYLCPNAFDDTKTVLELVQRYLATKTNVKPNTKTNYNFVLNALKKEEFAKKEIGRVKTSDARLWLIEMQSNGRGYSAIHTIRGVVRPAFQMAVDDDIIRKNPFDFQLKEVLINDSVKREAISKKDMRIFLNYIKGDNRYKKYYDAVFILFHTGLRISEFCGLTLEDIDMENRTINIDHQLQRDIKGRYYIISTKTSAGTRLLPMTDEVYDAFGRILENRKKNAPKVEPIIEGRSGFLFFDKTGKPTVAMHWEHYFNHMVNRHNEIFKYQLPNITPHVCRHTYCTNMAVSGISPKTLQYLMGHSSIEVTLNVYTHLKFDDAQKELEDMQEKIRKEMLGARKELEKSGQVSAKVIPMVKKKAE